MPTKQDGRVNGRPATTISAEILSDLAARAIRIQEAIEDGNSEFALAVAQQLEDELLTLRDAE